MLLIVGINGIYIYESKNKYIFIGCLEFTINNAQLSYDQENILMMNNMNIRVSPWKQKFENKNIDLPKDN